MIVTWTIALFPFSLSHYRVKVFVAVATTISGAGVIRHNQIWDAKRSSHGIC